MGFHTGFSFQEILLKRWVPSPTLQSRDWRGVCKKICKILSPKGLEGKILITKGLDDFSADRRTPLPP
jgi:hypothetical protein